MKSPQPQINLHSCEDEMKELRETLEFLHQYAIERGKEKISLCKEVEELIRALDMLEIHSHQETS